MNLNNSSDELDRDIGKSVGATEREIVAVLSMVLLV
jgi:hypothetical protein